MRWTEEQLEEYQRRHRKLTDGGLIRPVKPTAATETWELKLPTQFTPMVNDIWQFVIEMAESRNSRALKKDVLNAVNPTEDEEQMALFTWAHHMAATGHFPELSRLFHVPNGGSRGPAEAGRFKAMGVKPGVPDVFLDVPRGGFHGLRIEMKRRHGGKVSEDQTDWIDWYNANGYRAVICYGWDEAREEIENYLHGGDGE